MGATASTLRLHQSEQVDFGQDLGKRNYKQTVVIYYSFAEGFRKGMESTSGVFAVFELTGNQSYKNPGNDNYKLLKHSIKATFQGFRKTLHAEKKQP